MNKKHPHNEGFVPKYLLEKLAEKGHEEAKKTLLKMEGIQEKKTIAIKNENVEDSPTLAPVQAQRLIYDSENTLEFMHKLVRKEGEPSVRDKFVNFAYDFSGQTLNYLKNKLNRNSLDNRGMNLIFNVHYDNDLNNAFWDPDIKQLAFGEGDGKLFTNFTGSLDVVTHEIAHAITQFTNDLEYQHQSGALNEHFSDAIGSAVKQHVKGQNAETADWLIGNEIVGPEFPGKALRSMKDPGTASEIDDQPVHFRDYKKLPLEVDNGGVHRYSGIPNKAFYLVSLEIETDRAAFLWYTAWQNKQIMHPNATFSEAFKAILQAAKTLTSQGKLPQDTVKVVENAFHEVGIKLPTTV
ncbi:peptidase M4 family protein [Bacillus cereus]|uniref:M4 family metallopeptidase n=1 Tax=Bacillus cereus TaxID=1396 RepID=UPI000BEB79DF|nr:M4 family metallopeptidase [Bacillus cereus]PEE39711.1 peptidase M4 family protein [Bacillus cereus]PET46367.1 peptidase M4 family protein [Bacillus cereus]PEV83894.1 peptidase M4 family protein [Bacillus cereus]PFA57721.1 peptidase M4 family protein [Bacillus cereus]PFD80966.1 peptidase M4 family protein [Bacillus cereus]